MTVYWGSGGTEGVHNYQMKDRYNSRAVTISYNSEDFGGKDLKYMDGPLTIH
jgi:hypothetical protein